MFFTLILLHFIDTLCVFLIGRLRIFDFEKLYLAGEHSAQQRKKRLDELEEQFEDGEINVLSYYVLGKP